MKAMYLNDAYSAPNQRFFKSLIFVGFMYFEKFKKEGRVNGLAQYRYYRSRGSWQNISY